MAKKIVVGKRYFCVLESIFHRRVHVFINYSNAEFDKWCASKGFKHDGKNNNPTDFSGFSTSFYGSDFPTEWSIVIHKFEWTIKCQGTLLHEIVHTIVKIFAGNNIPFNADTQEFLAHDISNLYEDICAKILKLGRRKALR